MNVREGNWKNVGGYSESRVEGYEARKSKEMKDDKRFVEQEERGSA